MSKFHINKHGVPAQCKATKGNCPLGGDESHFDTEEEAQAYIDGEHESKHSILPGVRNIDTNSSFEVDSKVFDLAFQDSYDIHGFQVNGLSNHDIEDDPRFAKGLKDVIDKVNKEYGEDGTWVLVKEGNLQNYIDFNMQGHSGGEPVTKDELLERSNMTINGERFYVGTPADFAYEAEGGSFKMDKDDFNRAFPDTYNVHGFAKAGIARDELDDNPELKEKMSDLINYVDTTYPHKENWILVKESNLDDFNKHSIKDPEVKSEDLIKDSELYVNGERFYVADVNEINLD